MVFARKFATSELASETTISDLHQKRSQSRPAQDKYIVEQPPSLATLAASFASLRPRRSKLPADFYGADRSSFACPYPTQVPRTRTVADFMGRLPVRAPC